MVFLHGTAIMHASAVGQPRAGRVRQSRQRDASVLDFGAYVPTENAVAKLQAWRRHGADICYLSSHTGPADVALDRTVLAAHGFPDGPVLFRQPGESYADVASSAGADVVVEDDCESIGGARHTTAFSLARRPGRAPSCVVVPEFGGLTHLPDDPQELKQNGVRVRKHPADGLGSL
jgi:hypothetical protein